jgi:chromosome segregation ATPase
MSGDIRHFRRRFFGGFDENDVMRYIEELAAQRNKYKLTGDRLEKELFDLNAEIKSLQSELDEADRRIMEIKLKTLDEASDSLSSLNDSYSSMRSEVETTAYAISGELTKLSTTLSCLTSVLDKTGHRFTELQTLLAEEKNGAAAAFYARLKN